MKLMTHQTKRPVEEKRARTSTEKFLAKFMIVPLLYWPAYLILLLSYSMYYCKPGKIATFLPRIIVIVFIACMMLGIIFKQKHLTIMWLGIVVMLIALPIFKIQTIMRDIFYSLEGSENVLINHDLLRQFCFQVVVAIVIICYIVCFFFYVDNTFGEDQYTPPSTSSNKGASQPVAKEKLVVSNV